MLESLLNSLSESQICIPGDSSYEKAREVFNAMHNHFPLCIISTLSHSDIGKVLEFANNFEIAVAVRGRGHHVAGFGSIDKGIVIDFSPFRRVSYASNSGKVYVQPGASLGDLDNALNPIDLVVPSGTISTTGLAGLTLGGGIGWLTHLYGLSCDNLVEISGVYPDGQKISSVDRDYSKLLEICRGGGGGFAVLTEFVFKTRSLPLFSAQTLLGRNHIIPSHLKTLRKTCYTDRSSNFAITVEAEPERTPSTFLEIVSWGEKCRENLLQCQSIFSDMNSVTTMNDFNSWQGYLDSKFEKRLRGYWKTLFVCCDEEEILNLLYQSFESKGSFIRSITLENLYGEEFSNPKSRSYFPFRIPGYNILISARWKDPIHDEESIRWVRETYKLVSPYKLSHYLNYNSDEEEKYLSQDLMYFKKYVDPNNILRQNHILARHG